MILVSLLLGRAMRARPFAGRDSAIFEVNVPNMTPAQAFNEDQRARWNGIDGEYWARQQDHLDRTLSPVSGPLLAFAKPCAASTVLDVGCGCGATTLELARAVGPSGRVVGVDISEPMLARAK